MQTLTGWFVVKYVLPSGKVVGYHLDTHCHMGEREGAKVYRHSSQEKQLGIIRRNFKWVWDNSEESYRTQPAWEGATLEQIQIVAEAV